MRVLLGSVAVVAALALAAGQSQAGLIYTTSDFGVSLATIDTTTSAGATVGPFGYTQTYGDAFDLDGTLYATAGVNTLATVNLATGAATVLGPLPTSMYPIDFDSQGNLFGLAYDGNLYRLDKTSGASLQLIGNTGVSSPSVMDIAFDSSDTLWGTVNGYLYTFDMNTAAVTSTTAITGVPTGAGSIMGLMFDEFDVLFATAHVSNSPLFTVNTSTGAATIVGYPGLNGPHGGDIYVTGAPPIPEPASFALFGLGAVGLMAGAACRRRWNR
jgi:hypothetical protein